MYSKERKKLICYIKQNVPVNPHVYCVVCYEKKDWLKK